MAQKRMFDRAIIETDNFMDLSLSMKGLYFLLGMEADDEGFVSPRRVMKVHGGNDDDLKVLMVKNFVIPFKSGVVVITDWKKNNWLDGRRIKPTEYQIEKKLLTTNSQGKYELKDGLATAEHTLSNGSARIEESSIVENSLATHSVAHYDINKVISSFKPINANYKRWTSNKTERKACEDLIQQHTLAKVLEVLEILPVVNKLAYFPTITSPYKLLTKWADLMAAIEKKKNEKLSGNKGRGVAQD